MDQLNKSVFDFSPSTFRKFCLVLLFMVTFAHSLFLSNRGLNYYDEGIAVYGASQIINGSVLYKDIWSNYAPGQYYLLALTFKVFGQSIIAERILSSVLNSGVIFCVYLLAYRLIRDATALFSWFFALALFSRYTFYGCNLPTAFLFCLLSFLCVAKFLETEKRFCLVLSGILIGLVTLFRHDFGAYTLLSECAIIILFKYRNQTVTKQSLSQKLWSCLKLCLLLLPGLFMVLIPVVVFFVFTVPARVLFEDLIWFPFAVYSKVRYVPWPFFPSIRILSENSSRFFRHMLVILPSNFMLSVLVLLSGHLMLTSWRKLAFSTKDWLALLLLFMSLTLFNYSRILSDIYHMVPQVLLMIIVLPWLCRVFAQNTGIRLYSFLKSLSVFLVIVAFIAFAPMFVRNTGGKLAISQSKNKYTKLQIDRARHIEIKSARAAPLQQAVAFVKSVTSPEERIFVGNSRHDKTRANEPMFYFLAERHNATIFNDLHPGLVTTETVQKRIMEDLIRHRVRYIVLSSKYEVVGTDKESRKNNGVVLLDNFIKLNYDEVEWFSHYTILRSKALVEIGY